MPPSAAGNMPALPIEMSSQRISEAFEAGLASVIIPSYNRAALIVGALDSVKGQTYRPVELIVVDDGSSDDTAAVVSRWGRGHENADFRVRFVRQENRGAAAARNRGLIESRGEFIQFLDSDDALKPAKLSTQIAALRLDADLEWSVSRVANIMDGRVRNTWGPAPASSREDFAVRFFTGAHWAVLCPVYRREACRKVGLWNELTGYLDDWEYAARCVALLEMPHIATGVLASIGSDAGPERWIARERSSEAGESMIRCMDSAWAAMDGGIGANAAVRGAYALFMLAQAKRRWPYDRTAAGQILDRALVCSRGTPRHVRVVAAGLCLRLLGARVAEWIQGGFHVVRRRLVDGGARSA